MRAWNSLASGRSYWQKQPSVGNTLVLQQVGSALEGHTRLMADLLIERLGSEPFSWGGGSLADVGTLAKDAIMALEQQRGLGD